MRFECNNNKKVNKIDNKMLKSLLKMVKTSM